jgi:hypothetical protein
MNVLKTAQGYNGTFSKFPPYKEDLYVDGDVVEKIKNRVWLR